MALSVVSDCDRVAGAAQRAGFPRAIIPVLVAISRAETGGTCSPRSTCRNCAPGVREHSVGPYQINLEAHPSVTEDCARDFDCASRAAYMISGGGRNFRPWTTYTSGRYRQWLDPETYLALGRDVLGLPSSGSAGSAGGGGSAAVAIPRTLDARAQRLIIVGAVLLLLLGGAGLIRKKGAA